MAKINKPSTSEFHSEISRLLLLALPVVLILATAGGVARAADDPYEENDTRTMAWDFTQGEDTWLSTYGGAMGVQYDDDWYWIDVSPGRERVLIDLRFKHFLGDINLELWDSAGAVVASSATSTFVLDNEDIDTVVAGPGTYYIRVYGGLGGDMGNSYDLWWNDVYWPLPSDDPYEPNDTLSTAWDFSPGEDTWLSTYGGAMGIQYDDDWYQIDVSPTDENVVIDLIFDHAAGDMDLELLNSSSVVVAFSYSATDNENIDFQVAGPGTYYIRVFGVDVGNLYDVWWDDVFLSGSDDPYEPNNSALTSWDFSQGEGTWLNVYGGAMGVQWNSDWYQILVTVGDEHVLIDLRFQHAIGDINLQLVNSAGVVIASSTSTTDNEIIDIIVAAQGIYYIHVYSGDAGNSYDLWWDDIFVPPSVSDDPFEENDNLSVAWDFSLGEATWLSTYGGALGVQLDEDWYRINVTAGDLNVVINCTFIHADGDIDIGLEDAGGFVFASSESVSDNEVIDTIVPGPGIYHTRVYFGNAGNSYDLWWDDVGGAGVTITESAGSTAVMEGGLTDTYTVVLDTLPTADVTITITPDAQTTVSTTSLIFTSLNWNTAQTVTVSAVDDPVAEGSHTSVITHSASSLDANYNGIAISNVVANVIDNDVADDPYEENDNYLAAWDFSGGEGTILSTFGGTNGVQWDDDWYQIDVSPTDENVVIDLIFVHAAGDMDLELLNSSSVVVAFSYSVTDNENIDFQVAGPGTYYIRVFGVDVGNLYDVWWDDVFLSGSDDPYEPNNSALTSYDFSLGEGTWLSSYGGAMGVQWNSDWYRIDVTAGDERVMIDLRFQHAAGDINLQLVNSAGVVVAGSTSVSDNENIDIIVASQGIYYIHVYSGDMGNSYDLMWDDIFVPPPPPSDDPYEPNDTLSAAWDFSLGEATWLSTYGGALGMQLDDDWYEIFVTAGSENVLINCTFIHADGDIDVQLMNNVGVLVAQSTSITDNEIIDTIVPGPGTYYVRVYWGNTGNTYDLMWDDVGGGSVTITESGGSTAVMEGGLTDTYTVVLDTQPTADVTITITPDTQTTVSPTSLTFTALNWNAAQTVTVSAVDDNIDEASPHLSTISHAASSTDAGYSAVAIIDVLANITDNDTAGVTITESGGSTNVVESGLPDNYEIALTSEPAADVTILVATDGQTAVSPAALTFTSANWNTAQTVTVTAVSDAVAEGLHTSTITYTLSSADAFYDSATATFAIPDVVATVSDVVVTITASLPDTIEGGAATSGSAGEFTITRSAPATGNLEVSLLIFGTASNQGPGADYVALDPTVTILDGWLSLAVPVTPIDDAEVEGPETVTVLLTDGAAYMAGSPNIATVTIADDELPVVTITLTDVDAGESGNSATLLISRNGPTIDPLAVNLTITGTATEGVDFALIYETATILDGTVTIPAEQSSVAVAVSPLDDDDAEGPETVTVAIASGTGYAVGSSSSVTVTITDDEIGLAGGGGCGGCEVLATGTGETLRFSAIFGMLLPYLMLIGIVRRRTGLRRSQAEQNSHS